MTSEAELILIEKYLNKELEPEQMAQVEHRISSDQMFADQVALVKDMPMAIQSDVDNFRETLGKIMAEENQSVNASDSESLEKPQAKQISLWKLFLTAAAILAGITLAINILFPSQKVDLYAANFNAPSENITTRSESVINPDLQNALQAYNQGDYSTAIPLFDKYLADNPNEKAALFFQGISQMASGKYTEAVSNLIQIEDGPYQNSATWYLALVYIKINQKEKAKNNLNQLITSEGSYSGKARELLDQLD